MIITNYYVMSLYIYIYIYIHIHNSNTMQCYDVIVIITVKFQLINLQVKFSEGKHAYTLMKDLKCKYLQCNL